MTGRDGLDTARAPLPGLRFEPVTPDVRLDIFRGEEWTTAFAGDVRKGLAGEFRSIPPKYFYDARGSELFDLITELPEYYPTRAEAQILSRYGGAIVDSAAPETLVELGSGSSTKSEMLLAPLVQARDNALYVPIDVSEAAVREASVRLVSAYPGLRVHAVIGDFEKHLGAVPTAGPRLFVFLGGTIGNFTPDRMAFFLKRLSHSMSAGDTLLIGIDLVKDVPTIEAAYNDSQGVTAAFNKNVLASINANLHGDFDLDAFDHRAVFDRERSWIEMRLRANREHSVTIGAIDLTLDFAEGDEILTEISRKFRREQFDRDLASAGLVTREWFSDEDGRFALVLAEPAR